MDDSILRNIVRKKLRDGRLPLDSIPRVWGGPGAGEMCDACECIVTKDQLVIEGISVAVAGQSVQFHVGCFHLWDDERRAPELAR